MIHYENETNMCLWKYVHLLHCNCCKPPTRFDHLLWPSSGKSFYEEHFTKTTKPIYIFSYALVDNILTAPSDYVSPQCDRPSLTPIQNTNQPQTTYRNSTKSYQVVSMTLLNKSPFRKLLHQRLKHKLCTGSWTSLSIMRQKWKKVGRNRNVFTIRWSPQAISAQ